MVKDLKTKVFNLRLTEEKKEQLDSISNFYNKTASAVINDCIEEEYRKVLEYEYVLVDTSNYNSFSTKSLMVKSDLLRKTLFDIEVLSFFNADESEIKLFEEGDVELGEEIVVTGLLDEDGEDLPDVHIEARYLNAEDLGFVLDEETLKELIEEYKYVYIGNGDTYCIKSTELLKYDFEYYLDINEENFNESKYYFLDKPSKNLKIIETKDGEFGEYRLFEALDGMYYVAFKPNGRVTGDVNEDEFQVVSTKNEIEAYSLLKEARCKYRV